MAIVELRSVDELFGLDFFIPSYQRGYRWTQTQIKELLEDLYDFAVKKKDSDDYYCLQPVVIKKRELEWELVDGQQRLTALWLISALYYCSNKDDVVELVTPCINGITGETTYNNEFEESYSASELELEYAGISYGDTTVIIWYEITDVYGNVYSTEEFIF